MEIEGNGKDNKTHNDKDGKNKRESMGESGEDAGINTHTAVFSSRATNALPCRGMLIIRLFILLSFFLFFSFFLPEQNTCVHTRRVSVSAFLLVSATGSGQTGDKSSN